MELIRKSDALHAVLHNQGDAAVAAVEEIEAVKIVHCAECYNADFAGMKADRCYCIEHGCYMNADDWCSYGEYWNKEENENV